MSLEGAAEEYGAAKGHLCMEKYGLSPAAAVTREVRLMLSSAVRLQCPVYVDTDKKRVVK